MTPKKAHIARRINRISHILNELAQIQQGPDDAVVRRQVAFAITRACDQVGQVGTEFSQNVLRRIGDHYNQIAITTKD